MFTVARRAGAGMWGDWTLMSDRDFEDVIGSLVIGCLAVLFGTIVFMVEVAGAVMIVKWLW